MAAWNSDEVAAMWATVLVTAISVYVLIGLIVAVAFVARGVGRVDHAAAGAGVGFRLIILPASCVLWPFVVRRWLAARPPEPAASASSEEPS